MAQVDVLVAGAGAAGLVAALAAAEAGATVLVAERDARVAGTTAMSTGLIPAAGTPEQARAGIADCPERLAHDILAKHGGRTDARMVEELARRSAGVVAWLQRHGVPLSLVAGFTYPGHSVRRMMGTPHRTGAELVAALLAAVEAAGALLLTRARVAELLPAGPARIGAVVLERPDGALERVEARAVVLAMGGFAGDPGRVARFIPAMAGAVAHTHPGCRGDWIDWAVELGLEMADMDSHQGHGGLALGHAVPILWASMTEGGIQVNRAGVRFHDESRGYSEAAAAVNAQGGAVSIWDARIQKVLDQFDDTAEARRAGAIVAAASVTDLARRLDLPQGPLAATLAEVETLARSGRPCRFGRRFTHPPLAPPYHAARVTGALFHTQGGLVVDTQARVRHVSGQPFANLFAAGGTARGLSGPGAAGYIAGNGLLAATGLGRIAGERAAAVAREGRA
ncbi:MAG: FAD-dependent oxidoreductase [Sphingomonadaceae bacterium]|uniref:FAD-dependent oxidoreductase n=1 Tax=Thermaurantiacus sp. TaxID=2820283 RepID=UPI00298F2B90|nr:FAD-dependent oxidoreductase [Thermaurantiacus sp.]MCS6987567.1 FAD-dependent oxidoreductase [Sphingomonadaceae bacterium]MDW8415168.1 FAD-dependent oxidoreductase [Thermaurantiacus sp.]